MPIIVSNPTIKKTMTVITLMSAIQYSASPNDLTESAFIRKIITNAAKLKIQPGTCGNQNFKTSAAVERSTASVIAQLNQ